VPDNRRIQARHVVSLPATLTVGGTPSECTMLNLSPGGALVRVDGKYAMGQRLVISFRIPTLVDAIEVGGTVRWSNIEGLGVQFDGLRAREVWALNEYFKQSPS
jgi:hypothetical protein